VSTEALPALSRVSGMRLAEYRREHVLERVRRALDHERLDDVNQLVHLLFRSEEARSRFRRSVAVSVTGLFRDQAQFDLLEDTVLPELLARRPRLRVWSAGCSDGSELYSVALLLERLGALGRAHLLGSDLLDENLGAARCGVYDEVEISPAVRARVRWERRDLIVDPAPSGAWDLVVCRNVVIYFGPEAKAHVHEKLVAAVAPGGVLMLGRSERLSDPRTHGMERIGPHAYQKASA
jgi:chemotaxis protein methyltransferase CheR